MYEIREKKKEPDGQKGLSIKDLSTFGRGFLIDDGLR